MIINDINSRAFVNDKNTSENFCSGCKCSKLDVTNWLKDVPAGIMPTDIIEVRFKNTRKEFFKNINELKLEENDIVAVEASPGHDIGTVSLTGELVLLQMKKLRIPFETELKKVYRKAKEADVEKWQEAIDNEDKVMLKSRKIARELNLSMKISDVEFQGDGTKAIFYYIADERVDFRELIRVLADEFGIRIEMRQIGARQEAGRVGGIGPCGRELCCSSWMSSFKSVSTTSARHQELSLNPLKLAGQCGKLKCCLNFELEAYIDAKKDFPAKVTLEVKGGKATYLKSDTHKGVMWYSLSINEITTIIDLTKERVAEIIDLNKKGIIPENIKSEVKTEKEPSKSLKHELDQDSLTRFDDKKGTESRSRKSRNRNRKRKTTTQNPNPNSTSTPNSTEKNITK